MPKYVSTKSLINPNHFLYFMDQEEEHIEEWIDIKNRNKYLFDNTGDQIYRYRYESCERLILKHNK